MAIKSQGALLRMETARAVAKTITGITAANPPVVSSASHGYANGDIVFIDGVVGMVQVNGRAFVVANQASGTFELKGVDGSGYSAYTSGGSAYKGTMTSIAEVSGVGGFDGQAPEIDVTNLQSIAAEKLIGLQDFGGLSLNVFLRNADAGQIALRNAKEAQAAKMFAITLSDGAVSALVAFVKSFTFDAQRNDAVNGKVDLTIATGPAWFA